MKTAIRIRWTRAIRREQGFVLLAVLVCLVVTGLGLVTLAQRSMRLSALAIERQRDLQSSWGALSCQRALLSQAPLLFQVWEQEVDESRGEETASVRRPAPRTLGTHVVLNGVRYDLLLADENAKVNLNYAFHHRGGRSATERLVNRTLRDTLHPPVRLRPKSRAKPVADVYQTLIDDEPLPIVFESWGQVFDLARAIGANPARQLPQLTSNLTLWGHGKLNVRRAADPTIVDTGQHVVPQGPARRLLQGCRDPDKQNWHVDQLIKELNADDQEQFLLADMFTQHSSCFSLWTIVSSRNAVTQRLAILQVDDEGVMRTVEFHY